MKKIFKLMIKEKLYFFIMLLQFICSFCYATENIVVKDVVDNIHNDKLLSLCIFLFLLVSLRIISKTINIKYQKKVSNKFFIKFSEDIMKKLSSIDYQIFISYKTGDLINLLKSRVETVARSGIWFIFNINYIIFDFVFLLGSIFILNIYAGFIFLIIFTISIIILANISKLYEKYNEVYIKYDNKLMNKINNFILGFETVRTFNRYKFEKNKCIKNIKVLNTLNLKTAILNNFINVSIFIIYYVCFFALVFIALFIDINISTFLIIVYIMDCMFGPLFSLISLLDNFQNINVSMGKITTFLSEHNKIVDGKKQIDEFKKLEIKNLYFKYDSVDVLKNINLKINKNEKIGICGISGGGKSTLIKILNRYFDVDRGDILINNISIKEIKLSNLKQIIGLVQQTPFLFNDSIINNIKYGNLNATIDDIIEITKQVNMYDFIQTLPKGLNTEVGERGIKLSTGQQQRIIIARMLLKNPDIIIFDESTSSLDNENEKIIQEVIEKINKTIIVVAHRLTTIQNCDRIILIDDNMIQEEGSYEELMNLKGKFYKLNNK